MKLVEQLKLKKQKFQKLTDKIVISLGIPAITIIFYFTFLSYQFPAEKISNIENMLCIVEMFLLGGLFTSIFIIGEKINKVKEEILKEEVNINSNNLILNYKSSMQEILKEMKYKNVNE